MTWPQRSHHDGPRRAFLVERYRSPASAVDLAVSASEVARLCAGSDAVGTPVRYLYSVYLPTEDTCFCLFQAPSAEAVRMINNEGGFALDRIIDAVLLQPREPFRVPAADPAPRPYLPDHTLPPGPERTPS